MDTIQGQIAAILNTFLYYCDWVMLSDNGLSGGQLTPYTNLRTTMRTNIANIGTYTDDQLNALVPTVLAALTDLPNRPADFTTNMTALQTALSAL